MAMSNSQGSVMYSGPWPLQKHYGQSFGFAIGKIIFFQGVFLYFDHIDVPSSKHLHRYEKTQFSWEQEL